MHVQKSYTVSSQGDDSLECPIDITKKGARVSFELFYVIYQEAGQLSVGVERS